MRKTTKLRLHCNKCGSNTLHALLFEKSHGGSDEIDEYFTIQWGIDWRLVQCCGCEAVTLQRSSWNSEDTGDQGRPNESVSYFPARTFREKPHWQLDAEYEKHCPNVIRNLVTELYVCLQNACSSASAMIVRAIFEQMMITAVGDKGTFASNLTAFETAGYLTNQQRKLVEPMLEVGHASIHRGFTPRQEDIVTVVDILEGVMQNVYVLRKRVASLSTRIPKRSKKPRLLKPA